MDVADSAGWVPARVNWQGGKPSLEWYRLGTARFSEPFFDQTLGRCRSQARDGLPRRRSSLQELLEEHERRPGLYPRGFIFHMSRCGSTLAAQLLASLPDTIVISEAQPIDAILRAHLHDPLISDQQRIAWLRAMISVLGRPIRAVDKHYFIKFDAWNTMELPLIQCAFPDVPWIFVYREPLEVMISHARMRGSHVVPGVIEAEIFGLGQGASSMSLDHYGAEVLARICDAAAGAIAGGGRGLAVNYQELPGATWTRLLDYYKMPCAATDIEGMKTISGFHAKHPLQVFKADGADKRREASEGLKGIVDGHLRASFSELEALRMQNTTLHHD